MDSQSAAVAKDRVGNKFTIPYPTSKGGHLSDL